MPPPPFGLHGVLSEQNKHGLNATLRKALTHNDDLDRASQKLPLGTISDYSNTNRMGNNELKVDKSQQSYKENSPMA